MKNGIPNYNEIIFTKEQEEEIINDYINNNMSTVKIGQKFGCSHKPIAKVLEKHGIKRTGVGRRKYFFNEHYLDFIDTKDKAYILGFLFADGSNFSPKQTVSMSLQECDKYILEYISKEFEQTRELEFIDYSNKHDFGYNYVNQYRLLLFSKHLCDTLTSYGMIRAKSYSMDFPTCIPHLLLKYFVLGYFDGNGGLTVTKNSNSYSVYVSITSTFSFCNSLKEILEKELNLSSLKVSEASNHNGITATLSISKRNECMLFLNWIYEDAEHYLIRKHNKYLLCKQNNVA